MVRGYLLLALILASGTGWSQAPLKDCLSLRRRLEAFDSKYSFFRFGGPSATLQTVEAELGKPQLETNAATNSVDAVYTLEGCTGRVLINAEGIAWITKFAAVAIPEPPRLESLDQLQDLEEQLTDLKARAGKLEALKATLIEQAAKLLPEALPAPPTPLQRAVCEHRAGHLPEAIELYSESLRETPSMLGYTNRALAYFANGKTTEGMADLGRARALDADTARKGLIKVKGYTRSDGTYVAPYTRTAPRKKQ